MSIFSRLMRRSRLLRLTALNFFKPAVLQCQPSNYGVYQGLRATQSMDALPLTDLFSAQYATKGGKKQKGGVPGAEAQPASFDPKSTEKTMQRSVDHLVETFRGLRTGRVAEGMLDMLKVDAYGDSVPIKAVGAVSVRDAQTLLVSVFDPTTLKAVEKSIRDSSLGLTPKIEGQEVVVPVPRPTRESLNAVAKMLKDEGESAKISIRQARKAAMDVLKGFGDENDKKRLEKQVQTLTDKFTKQIEDRCAAKEKEIKSAL